MTPQQLAEACAAAMWADDHACQALGLTITRIAPGEAELAMTVGQHMVNGHGICHGGYIFTLADSAFAYACNSFNRRAVAQSNTITYLRPAKLGDRLSARGLQTTSAGRSGITDVTVADQDGRVIAVFRGLSRHIEGHLVEVTA
jgi:acyl-CoA thioesterase